jgi:undecaprenyl-diphosphatase
VLEWDTRALLWMNGHHDPVIDAILYPISLAGEKGLLLVLLYVGIFALMPRRAYPLWAGIGVALVLGDLLLMTLLNLAWMRDRPFLALEGVRQVGPLWYSSSFPSGHAQYSWVVTVVLGAHRRAWLWVMIPFTLLSCYARPYFGMHYPLDVLAGTIVGIAYGAFIVACQRTWRRRAAWLPVEPERIPPEARSPERKV